MKLTNVKLMTPEEVAQFKKKVYGAGSEKKQLSANYCAENIEDLIKKHKDYYDIHLDNAYNKYVSSTKEWQNKILENNLIYEEVKSNAVEHFCNCGAKLRYINNFDFVGCSDYSNKENLHVNINFRNYIEIDDFYEYKANYEFSNSYINDFKRYYNIEFVMSSVIYEFLFTIYKQQCYSENLNYNTYQTGVKSSSESKKQELILKSILNTKFDKVKEQVHFSLYIDGKYSVRVLDFICSKDDTVYIIELKKHSGLFDYLKLDLYKKILQEYLKIKNNNRYVKTYTIIYEGDGDDNCLTINQLQNEL